MDNTNDAPESAAQTPYVAVPQFVTQLPVYEGPLDVLLRLIEERELEITKVSLAAVTGQFIAHISRMENREPQYIANFLQIAAKLIVLKSRVLLPQVTVIDESEDETDDLVAALQAYQIFKRTARVLQEREKRGLRSYRVEPPTIARPKAVGLPLDNVTTAMIARAMQRVIDRWMPPPPVDNVMSRLPFTVNDCMDRIRTTVLVKPRVRFDEMLVGMNTRVEIVITLLALLELLKRFAIRAHQAQPFGEIWFEHFPEAERPWVEMGQTPPALDDEVEFAV
ncbi:MAG: segregation/condensation protein A [Chloroflexi bacterium]|nr:segregation/condensation protein A [Chloroflexota bacterium]